MNATWDNAEPGDTIGEEKHEWYAVHYTTPDGQRQTEGLYEHGAAETIAAELKAAGNTDVTVEKLEV